MMTQDSPAPLAEHEILAVQGGMVYMTDLERRLAPYFERAEPRQRAIIAIDTVAGDPLGRHARREHPL